MAHFLPTPTLILVAGGPGAGKSVLGRALATRIATAILLDKDVLASPWVDAMLLKLNAGKVDRDSDLYWNEVRPLEYSSLMAIAYDNLALGKSVIAVAPFGPEVRDPAWITECAAAAGTCGARLKIIWMTTVPDTARSRMIARNDARDRWKLGHWSDFTSVERFAAPHGDFFTLRNDATSRIDDLVERALIYLELN